jgi:hypothetical protein
MKIEYSKGERASQKISFEPPPDAETRLLAAIEEAERGEAVCMADVLKRIRRS